MSADTPSWFEDWLARLGFERAPAPSVDALDRIVRAQLATIPFDGLDPLVGRRPSLASDDLAEKILRGRRGGYCFEVNALLYEGLLACGFDVSERLARVLWMKEDAGPRTHILLSVRVEGETWLADAGFGAPCPGRALPMDRSFEAYGIRYRTAEVPDLGYVLERSRAGGPWAPLYCWTDERVGPSDIEGANLLACTWPGVPFLHRLIAAKQVDGHVTALADRMLIERFPDGSERETLLDDGAAVLRALEGRLGIVPDAEMAGALLERLDP